MIALCPLKTDKRIIAQWLHMKYAMVITVHATEDFQLNSGKRRICKHSAVQTAECLNLGPAFLMNIEKSIETSWCIKLLLDITVNDWFCHKLDIVLFFSLFVPWALVVSCSHCHQRPRMWYFEVRDNKKDNMGSKDRLTSLAYPCASLFYFAALLAKGVEHLSHVGLCGPSFGRQLISKASALHCSPRPWLLALLLPGTLHSEARPEFVLLDLNLPTSQRTRVYLVLKAV